MKGVSSLVKKNKMASARWNSLPKPVQEEWLRKANTIKKDPVNMEAETKAKLIDQHIKLVAKEVQCIYNYHFEIKDKLISSIVTCSALKGTGIKKLFDIYIINSH